MQKHKLCRLNAARRQLTSRQNLAQAKQPFRCAKGGESAASRAQAEPSIGSETKGDCVRKPETRDLLRCWAHSDDTDKEAGPRTEKRSVILISPVPAV